MYVVGGGLAREVLPVEVENGRGTFWKFAEIAGSIIHISAIIRYRLHFNHGGDDPFILAFFLFISIDFIRRMVVKLQLH